MANSYTIIKRFTPPTCTLEIWGENSALSRWTKKKVVKNIQFKLSFDDPRNLDAEPIIIKGDRDKLEQLYDTVLTYTGNFLEQSFTASSPTYVATINQPVPANDKPYLSSKGLVEHEFNVGNLTTNKDLTTINLSATQLFDLISALEEYNAEISAINELEAQKAQTRNIFPLWGSVAGILLAIGITSIGIQIANKSANQESSIAQQNEESQATDNSALEKVIPPEVPEVAEKPTVITRENNPLSSTEKLPPPPAVDSPKPPPNIPDPAKYPPSGNLTIPPISSLPLQIPDTAQPLRQSQPSPNSTQDSTQVESNIAVNSDTAQPQTPPNTERVEIAINEQNSQSDPAVSQKSQSAELFEDRAGLNEVIEEEIKLKDNFDNDSITANNTEIKPTVESDSVSKIPQNTQLQEIKSYFQQKWQSPTELKQTLEYRLVINQNGSIKRIIPIGKASAIYVDRTGIPLMGEAFVSPLPNSDSATVRLLLSPDGEVRAFLE